MIHEGYNININAKQELCVSGCIDMANVKEACNSGLNLINTLNPVRVDLSAVRYADSSSLAMLIEWIRSAKQQHKEIMLSNMPQFMLDLGRVCGLDAILPIKRQ